jgi:ketosteroid isomerase-like protein
MKRHLLLATALVIAVLPSTLLATMEEEVRQAEKEWAAAVAAKDFAKVDKILADGLIYAHSTGIVETKAQYMAKVRGGTQNYDAIEHSKIQIKVYGNTAVAHSHVRMAGTNASGPFDNKLMMMHFWVKEGGAWKLAAHQTTLLPN